ncbi:synaptopodin 2-like protein [Phyllopteryx taeniolatus]|uniref:synaptopodin 2-like protein n=1 Tax=Phyllopteryx taeniolatus TaxID=161469 RepID=UPI002AD4D462|nr:synaptopodin 2-like protein [Phyllopteryx taeniolatus]XP_061646372.1 synaptopodin 2-like protein [Phyllopteryx taeniolatus]
MVTQEVLITLSGGAPWGFRLQGGVEHQKPLQVAKVRKRSKACRAGLREADELVSINNQPCEALSHAQAMNLIDASPGILHIRVKRVPAGFQSVVLVTRAPSPRIDKEYRASLQTLSPTDVHQAPVREVHRSRSSLTSGLTSPPGSEAYYGETDSDAEVAGYERQRRQKRRSPNSNPAKQTGWTSPGGGETSEMSGYDSAPDANAYLNSSEGFGGGGNRGLPGVARREVIYQPAAPGMWSSQTSTETSSIISSADDQGPRDGEREEDFLELANIPLVSPERAKEALMLGSRSQLVPMVGPVNNPIDEELTTTYMEKAKQAKLNRGDTSQDKHVKEARSKCRTIASLLTDAPNPHSKGVLMFKKRRQRSKKYTLTSFGSVDEDQCPDSQEEDGVLLGSESEFEEEGFSSAPDPTWDSDYLNMLEKRATAGVEGRGDGEEDAPSPGLNATTGKGAQLFEQQRKRAAEHAKKVEATHSQVAQQAMNEQAQMFYPDIQGNTAIQQDVYQAQATFSISNGDPSQATGGPTTMGMQGRPWSAISSVDMIVGSPPPVETPIPEAPASNVLNRTARPFTPGFITIRAATAPVAFKPSATKTNQRPTSAAAVPPPFSTVQDQAINATSVMLQLSPGPPVSSKPAGPVTRTVEASVTLNPSTSPSFVETTHTAQQMSAAYPVPYVNVPPMAPPPPQAPTQPMFSAPPQPMVSAPPEHMVPALPQPVVSATPQYMVSGPILSTSQIPSTIHRVAMVPPVVPVAPQCTTQIPMTPVALVSLVSEPEAIAPTPVLGPGGRTGILLEARRRGGKPKPMFNVPEVKKNSPNPELLSMVQNFDERATHPKYGRPFSEDIYDGAQEGSSAAVNIGKMPPPVAPKPQVLQEAPEIIQAGGKGAQLFTRRQNRMGMYVVDTPPQSHHQQEVFLHGAAQPPDPPSQWKYSSNVRAPPPIGYNPLLAPSIPTGPRRNMGKPSSRGKGGSQREGIQALDFMRRQPYQLSSAMFNYSGSAANISASPSHQDQRQGHDTAMVGSSLTSPKQIPVKIVRAYEIKRFSTPTPMSAPTLVPKVLAPRSATTLGERINHSDMTTPPPGPTAPTPDTNLARAPFRETALLSSQIAGLPTLPILSAMPPPNPVPGVATHYSPVSYTTGLQGAKQFQSAPELSILSSLPPLKANPIQAPKPRFVATKGGVQPRVWRPGAI